MQIPIRHPVEHAHRVQTVNLLSRGRLRFGFGSGSTCNDFEAVQADFDARFKVLPGMLEVMRKTWNGELVYGPALTQWPGTEGGPPVLLGAWRSQRWINLAAHHCQGWIASGIHSSWEDVEIGLRMYREAGGNRAIVANIFTDFRPQPPAPLAGRHLTISLLCTPAEARDRLKRLEQLGVDDALLVAPFDDPGQLETIFRRSVLAGRVRPPGTLDARLRRHDQLRWHATHAVSRCRYKGNIAVGAASCFCQIATVTPGRRRWRLRVKPRQHRRLRRAQGSDGGHA